MVIWAIGYNLKQFILSHSQGRLSVLEIIVSWSNLLPHNNTNVRGAVNKVMCTDDHQPFEYCRIYTACIYPNILLSVIIECDRTSLIKQNQSQLVRTPFRRQTISATISLLNNIAWDSIYFKIRKRAVFLK